MLHPWFALYFSYYAARTCTFASMEKLEIMLIIMSPVVVVMANNSQIYIDEYL